MFCKVLKQTIKGFRAAITKKPHFSAKNGQKKPFFGLKQCFWGLSGHSQGPIPYFEGAGLREARLSVFWSK